MVLQPPRQEQRWVSDERRSPDLVGVPLSKWFVAGARPQSTHRARQFIFRHEIGDAYLGAVSRFMSNAFEYGDALLPRPEGADPDTETPPIESNQPYINLATYDIVACLIHMALTHRSQQVPNGRPR